MKKSIFTLTLLLLFTLTSRSQYVFKWADALSGPSDEEGRSVVADAAGNVFVVGTFSNMIDLDPGAGTATFTSAGINDIFIARYNNLGDLVWAKRIGDASDDLAYNLQMDGNNDLYLTGVFEGTVDFDPSPGTATLTSAGAQDIFIAKFSNAGNYVWAKGIGGTNADYGASIAVDASGNVYATGYFQGEADFDPGPGTFTLNAYSLAYAYIAKYNSTGGYVWANAIDGGGLSSGKSIQVDASGNVFVTGEFVGTPDFDPSAGTFTMSTAGGYDAFIAKYTNSGAFGWSKAIGGSGNDSGNSLELDASSNIYLTGVFTGTADLDPGAGTASVTSMGSNDIFIATYNNSAVYQWGRSIGGTGNDSGNEIQLDASGNIFLTGSFQSTVDLDPGAGTTTVVSAGNNDMFALKLSNSGNYAWSIATGGINDDSGNSISIDGFGNPCLTGVFRGNVDFDVSASTASLAATGADAFVLKYEQPQQVPTFIPERWNETELSVYPNPVIEKVVASIGQSFSKTQVIIYNSVGEILYNKETAFDNGSAVLDVTQLTSGVYIVEINTEKGCFRQKLIKQ